MNDELNLQPDPTDEANASWRNLFQGILKQFLSVHFVITLIVLVFWIQAVGSPVQVVNDMITVVGDAVGNSNVDGTMVTQAATAIDSVTQSTVALSGIFTTVLGVVLGHYFGQRGQETAEIARDRANALREQLVSDFEDKTLVEEELELLNSQVDDANAAVADAVATMFTAGISEIAPETTLGLYIEHMTRQAED